MSTTIPKQIIAGARTLLDGQDKWLKDSLYNDARTKWCVIGAIEESAGRIGIRMSHSIAHYDLLSAAIARVSQVVRRRPGRLSILHFNDHKSTTYEDIISVLAEAMQEEVA